MLLRSKLYIQFVKIFFHVFKQVVLYSGMNSLLAFVTKVTKFSLLISHKKINCMWINTEMEFILMNLVTRMFATEYNLTFDV